MGLDANYRLALEAIIGGDEMGWLAIKRAT